MGDAFDSEPQGAFGNFLDWIGNTAQVGMNVARGNVGAAARHAVDFASGPLRAVDPFDLIGTLSRPEDNTSGADLLGIDRAEHPLLGFGADVGVGTALDPLSWVPGSVVAKGASKAGKGVKVGAEALGASKLLDGAEQAVRRTFGAQRMTPETRAMVDRSRAASFGEKHAGFEQARSAFDDLNEPEQQIVGDVLDNFKWQGDKLIGKISDSDIPAVDRVALHPEVTANNADKIRRAVSETIRLGQEQKKLPGLFRDPADLSDEYLMRQYNGMDEGSAEKMAMGQSSAMKERTLPAQEDVMGFLNDPKNAGITYERNALKRVASRAEQQGSLAQRTEIGRSILGPDYIHSDEAMRSAVEENISKLPPEEAQVVMDMYKPGSMKGRTGVEKVLAWNNGLFKKYAVYGAFIPKFGSIVRNKISGIWQAAAEPGTRAVAFGQVRRLGSDLADAITQSFGLKKLQVGELSKSLDQIDAAYRASGGSMANAMKLLPPDLADAVKYGVTEGFVSSEDLLGEMAKTKWHRVKSIMDWPGRMFQGVESRMRLGAFLDLKKAGKSAEDAARATKDAFYDYAVSSRENRLARDIIPFFQFQAKAIPQTAKLLAEKPAVAVALSQALNSESGPLYPWMQGKTNIPLGKDEEGNDQYATGLGLPFEAANFIPASFRDAKKSIVGSSNPLLKTLFAELSGSDPYFETPYGSYDKIPGIGPAGEAGQIYNQVAGTGMIQPIDSLLRLIGGLTDDRHSAAIKALDLLTGVNVASVDPDLALQKQLQEMLSNNPDVQQHRSFYDKSDDPETKKILEQYQEAKARVKAKRGR